MPYAVSLVKTLLLTEWLRSRGGQLWLMVCLATGVYLGWFFMQGGALLTSLSYGLLLPLAMFALFAAWRVYADVALAPVVRRAWFFFSLSLFMQLVGSVVELYEDVILHLAIPFFTADIFFLSFFPLTFWSLLILSGGAPTKKEWLKFLLDFLAVMLTAWMVAWYFLIVPAALASNVITQIVAVVYPISNLVVLGEVVLLLARGRQQPLITRASLAILLLGLLCFVAANLLHTYYSLRGEQVHGLWLTTNLACAYLLFAFAAIRQRLPSLPAATDSPWWRLFDLLPHLFPFSAIAIGYGLLIFVARSTLGFNEQLQGVVSGAAVLTILIVARQILDLRDNMRLNEELRALSQDLEQRVLARTRELENSKELLLASEKMALIGTLAAGVAHEISNPLSAIVTSTEYLQDEINKGTFDLETAKEVSSVLSRSATHALEIAQALRNQSRGHLPELVAQPFAEVIHEALVLMSGQIKRWRKVKLVSDLDPALPRVKCDRNQIAQVVFNLLNNAHDAMPVGGTITLRAYGRDRQVILEVQDQGQGIAPENLDKLFKPFFTTKPIGKGSGLGLSIVRTLVEDHGGSIEVQSAELGQGTTFRVSLPVAADK